MDLIDTQFILVHIIVIFPGHWSPDGTRGLRNAAWCEYARLDNMAGYIYPLFLSIEVEYEIGRCLLHSRLTIICVLPTIDPLVAD